MTDLFGHITHMIFAASSAVKCPSGGTDCVTNLPVVSTHGALTKMLAILFGVLAVVAVIIVAIGGVQFITSQGDPQNMGRARMTIIYAVIGLVIALSAEAIVGFVLNKF